MSGEGSGTGGIDRVNGEIEGAKREYKWRKERGERYWSQELWLNSICSIWLSCLSAPLEVNVFLHWVIDPTLLDLGVGVTMGMKKSRK